MHRLFIALTLPHHVREEISNLCFGIPHTRWTPMEQMHLTLRFIGEVESRIFSEISDILDTVSASGFSFNLKGVGFFPPRKQPRIVWVGVAGCPALHRLVSQINRVLDKAGIEREGRKFHPHITIGRMQGRLPGTALIPFLTSNSLFQAGPVAVEEFHLVSSVLSKSGACHAIECSYPLDTFGGE